MQKMKEALANQLKIFGEFSKKLTKQKLFFVYIGVIAFILASIFCKWLVLPLVFGVLIVSICVKFDDIVAMLFFLYPFFAIFIINEVNLYFYMFACVVLILATKYLIQAFKKSEKIDWVLIIGVAVYCLFLILPIRKSVDGKFSNFCDLMNLASVGVFFVLLYLCNAYKKQIDFIKIIRLFIIGFLTAGLFGTLYPVSGRLKEVVSLIYYGYDMPRYAGLFSLPNTLAIVSLATFSVVIYLLASKKIGDLEGYVYLFVSFLIGYLTLARSFLYCSAIAMALYVIYVIARDKKRSYIHILILLAEIAVIMLVCYKVTIIHYDRLSLSDLTHGYGGVASESIDKLNQIKDPGRGGLIKKYLYDFVSSGLVILFGRGISYDWLGGYSSHNTYLQGFWNTGVVGVVLLIAIVWLFVLKFTNMKSSGVFKKTISTFTLYILLLPVLALMFIENLFMNMQMIIVVMIVVFAICLKTQKDNQQADQEEKKGELK